MNNESIISFIKEKYGETVSKKDLIAASEELNIPFPAWITVEENRISRGMYKMPQTNVTKTLQKHDESLIPEKDSSFEKFGSFTDIKAIIKSRTFFPIFICGASGLGKTHAVLQACAELKREVIRINFSPETDQSDLIGSNTLIDGNIVFNEGPVVTAMKLGAILLMDDVDRCPGSTLTSLLSVMEGNGLYLTKTGEHIKAKEGFNIIVTANTKGYGDETGKYLAQILDSAFLERFPITFEQTFPTEKTETKILQHYLSDNDFISNLVKWANVIRKTYENGGIDEIISTRRLIHIAKTYEMFKDKKKAITLCCARFDLHVKDAFIDLYEKIDGNLVQFDENGNEIKSSEEIAF